MHDQPTDKNSTRIAIGDNITTQSGGKTYEGEVQKMAVTQPEAERIGARNPAKIVLKEDNGHEMHRDPNKVEVDNEGKEYKSAENIGA